jgi:membrane-anchored protein YejM (alkaline phosphatase superfamily)
LRESGKHFVLVNKNGVHFPYEISIPPENVTNDKMENYRTSVQMNSIRFLENISRNVLDDTVIFYTSDHGQNFLSRATHCNTGDDVSVDEYAVPFIVITANDWLRKIAQSSAEQYSGNFSHLEISESIRNILGEKIQESVSMFYPRKNYGFFCGLYGQPGSFFGVLPSCKKILRNNIRAFALDHHNG